MSLTPPPMTTENTPPDDEVVLVVRQRISARLLVLTLLSIMLAEVLIFVPSIAHFRDDWLSAKIETLAVAGLFMQQSTGHGDPAMAPEQEAGLLKALDAQLVGIVEGGASKLVARQGPIDHVDLQVDLTDTNPLRMIGGAFDTLIFGGDRVMRISGPVGDGSLVGEVVMSEAPLRRDMLIYSRNIFLLSLGVASFAALLVFGAISRWLIRPIRAMTRSMVRFGEKPSDPARVIVPSRRADEIGIAEAKLAEMQTRLAETMREQRHLANLGLAVSKINHDLRNILASAQMISDRLSTMEDPRVQRVAPMLLRSLDRALNYTNAVLAYGRAVESAPVKRRLRLKHLVDDVYEMVAVSPEARIDLVNGVDETLEIAVDPDQFHRVLVNLCRNAVQALEAESADLPSVIRRVSITAEWQSADEVLILVEDTGPGLPPKAREKLFKAFEGSARTGGTGLGLAIVAEIVEAHRGHIRLCDESSSGTRFEIRLPADNPGLNDNLPNGRNGAVSGPPTNPTGNGEQGERSADRSTTGVTGRRANPAGE